MISNKKGNTLVELIMVMAILTLFGVTIFVLISTGSDTQKSIISKKDAQVNARIALSYVNVRIRQNDKLGNIEVLPNSVNGNDSIFIKDFEYGQSLWIFWDNGCLYEQMTSEGETVGLNKAYYIADIEGFVTGYDQEDGSITNAVEYLYDGKEKSLSSTIFLRSGSDDL